MKEVNASESIQLTRIHAFQWYGFCDSFDLAGQTIITGVYGCGKTGLIDLVQTVLLGPPEREARYNLSLADIGSSGRNEKRDLRGYCLQDLNLVEHGHPVYARSSSRTYIALEFTWPNRQRRETWGLRIEYTSIGADADITYWKVPARLELSDFLGADEVPKSAEEWEAVLGRYKEHAFPSKAEYLEALSAAQHLNFNARVFKPLLLQTLQFKFGRDFTEFCRNNILPEDPVQLEEVRESYDRYHSLVAKMQLLREQRLILERIHEAFAEQEKIGEEITALEWFQRKHALDEAKLARETADARWKALCAATEEWHRRSTELAREQKETGDQLVVERALLRALPNAGDFEDLKKRQHSLPREIEELQTTLADPVAAFREKCGRFHRLWATGRQSQRQYGWAEPADLPTVAAEVPAQLDANELQQRINELHAVVDPLATHFARLAGPLERELQQLENRRIELRGEISRLEGAKTAEQLPLHDALAARLGARDVQLLGDLCTIEDEEWTDALEINFGHKFSSVVADDRIKDAFGIFNELPRTDARERLLCRADMWKLPGTIRPGSLAEKITSDDDAVRQLLAHLFGSVTCCRTVEEAEAHPRSILPSGAIKQPTGRRRLQATPNEYVIGESGRQRMLARKQEEKSRLELEITALDRKVQAARTPAEGFQSIKLGLLNLAASKIHLLRELDGKKREQQDTSRRLDLFENREQLEELQVQITTLSRSLDTMADVIREHYQKQPADVLDAKLQADDAKRRHDREELVWLTWQNENPDRLEAASKHLGLKGEILRETEAGDPASAACKLLISRRETLVAQTRGRLSLDRLKLKQDPRFTDYRDLDENDFSGNVFFDKKLAYIRETGLDELTDQATRAELEWEERFQNQVLGQLQHRLEEVVETFRGLRRITAGQLIGGASYDFRYEAVEGTHFDLMRRLAADREMNNLLSASDPQHAEIKRQRRAAMELLSIPSGNGDAAIRSRMAARARELLDARFYFTYNMEIVEPGRTEKISLAHRGRKGSGGETYNPYFIALTAAYQRAFYRHLNKGRPSISLLLMDEAFKVLNSEAVRDCVRIIRELGLQGVISCTDTNGGQVVELFEWIMIVQKRVLAGEAVNDHDLIENSIMSAARNDPEILRVLTDFAPDVST